MPSSNNSKSRNWLARLKHFKIQRSTACASSSNEAQVHVPFVPTNYRRSIKGSIIRMHSRVKNVFSKRASSNTNAVMSVPTSSHFPNSVTLRSPVQNVNNIYSLEPIKQNDSHIEEQILRLPGQMNVVSMYDSNSSNDPMAPVIPPRRNFPQLSLDVQQNGLVPTNEIASLSNFYWYWGPISRAQAEERLKDSPDGAFLVRDSTSDRYIFTMSFRSIGKILHTRIEFRKTGYSLFDQVGHNSIAELVEDAISKSKNGVYCYTKPRDDMEPNFPVRLTLPVSRYDKVPTLKYLSRFVIRQFANINNIDKLPLPVSLIQYLQEEGQYF